MADRRTLALKGFTLLEVLLVIVMVGLLITLALSSVSGLGRLVKSKDGGRERLQELRTLDLLFYKATFQSDSASVESQTVDFFKNDRLLYRFENIGTRTEVFNSGDLIEELEIGFTLSGLEVTKGEVHVNYGPDDNRINAVYRLRKE